MAVHSLETEPTGAAVSVTTNDAYAKNVELTITGGTFTSKNQSAFYEGPNTVYSGSALTSVDISGGDFTTDNESLSAVTLKNEDNTAFVSITDTAENNLLYRGVNLTGVADWTGDDDSGYTLTIDEAGSYKLMDAFTTTGSGIQITAGGVTLDGDGKKITVGKMTNSAAALTVTETAAGTTLKNLNMMASSGSETGATMQGMVNLLARTTILGGTLDMSGMSLPVDGTYGSNPTVVCIAGENNDGTTISGVTMSAPARSPSEDSGGVNSNTFCVFINPAKNVKLDGNTFNLGDTAKRSVGVEVRGGSTGTVIDGNIINAPESVEYVRAVQIFTNGGAGESLTITNNELTGPYKAAVNAVLTSDENKRAKNPTLPVTIEGNNIPNAEAGITISGTSETVTLRVTGTVEAADFSGLSQDQIISGTGVDVTDVDFNPQPAYSSSSGNMNNAYRVLFNDGATTLSVQTDLSSGDKLTKPETPVKDGYTFAGWYKDSACTNPWDFETGIPGDMTLYAKWTAAGSSGETEATEPQPR